MIRVLVVDDQVLFRSGLANLIAEHPNMSVVGEAADGEEAVAMARERAPDIVLMDIKMPGMDGLQATRLIREELPSTHVVILTVSDAEDDLFEAIKAGARGYLLKNLRPETLFDLLEGVLRGEAAVSPVMAAKILDEFNNPRHHAPAVAEAESFGLTNREREVLELVIAGEGNKEIASRLGIAEGTVKRHLHSILAKLHVRSRAQAIAHLLRHEHGEG